MLRISVTSRPSAVGAQPLQFLTLADFVRTELTDVFADEGFKNWFELLNFGIMNNCRKK